MGNALSSRSWSASERKPMVMTGGTTNKRGSVGAPLFLDEIEPTPAEWSQESKCVMIRRFFGWLPDSTAEKLKQDQKVSLYQPSVVANGVSLVTSRGQAIVYVQRVYRRYRLMCKWHLVSQQVLEIVQNQQREKAAQDEEEEMLASFHQIMASGFSAQKVSIDGSLKNIQLQLVLRPEQEDCYLTWTPSRKRQPRINLYDVEEVVPVLKEGNKYAQRLANKVSHRRGLIIVCKSHHRGRVVLQMSSKRERKVLLLGFQRLLEDLNRFVPNFDDTGSMRKRLPRRQSAIQFFEKDQQVTDSNKHSDDDDDGDELRAETPVDELSHGDENVSVSPSKTSKRHSTSIARFYETRFDESDTSPVAAPTKQPSKPLSPQRSSMVM